MTIYKDAISRKEVIGTIKSEFGFIPMGLELKIQALPSLQDQVVELIEKKIEECSIIGDEFNPNVIAERARIRLLQELLQEISLISE